MKRALAGAGLMAVIASCSSGTGSASLEGTWISGCTVRTGGGSESWSAVFQGSAISTANRGYASADCSGTLTPNDLESGVFKLGGSVAGVDGAVELDIEETSPASHTLYTIIKIDGGTFTLGMSTSGHDGSTMDQRHNTLSDQPKGTYTRQ